MSSISNDAVRLGLCLSITLLHAARYAFPCTPLRDLIFLSLFLTTLTAIFSIRSTNAHSLTQITTNTFQWTWVAGNFLLIDPETSRRRNSDAPDYDITKEPSMWKRFRWGLEYAINNRGIGWNWQVSGVQGVSPRENRAHFIWQGVKRSITWSIIEDLILVYRESQPFYASYGMAPGYGSSADGGLVRLIVHGVLTMVRTYAQIQAIYSKTAVVMVALGLAKPTSWPPIFGNISETHTLRSFWGQFWHQLLRDTFMIYSKAILSLTSIKPKTYTYRYSQLYIVFLISAFMHTVITSTLPYPNGLPEGKNTPYAGSDQIVFFLSQAVAIHVEDTIIELFNNNNGKKEEKKAMLTKVLGWTWLVLWFGMTGRYLVDEITIGGADEAMGKSEYSLVKWLGIKF